ncbi:hypothetical protein GGF32_006494 [Allomyces javanicus]|nr:hypothetical protein GGF32_006494 [Allomyces javanicus]
MENVVLAVLFAVAAEAEKSGPIKFESSSTDAVVEYIYRQIHKHQLAPAVGIVATSRNKSKLRHMQGMKVCTVINKYLGIQTKPNMLPTIPTFDERNELLVKVLRKYVAAAKTESHWNVNCRIGKILSVLSYNPDKTFSFRDVVTLRDHVLKSINTEPSTPISSSQVSDDGSDEENDSDNGSDDEHADDEHADDEHAEDELVHLLDNDDEHADERAEPADERTEDLSEIVFPADNSNKSPVDFARKSASRALMVLSHPRPDTIRTATRDRSQREIVRSPHEIMMGTPREPERDEERQQTPGLKKRKADTTDTTSTASTASATSTAERRQKTPVLKKRKADAPGTTGTTGTPDTPDTPENQFERYVNIQLAITLDIATRFKLNLGSPDLDPEACARVYWRCFSQKAEMQRWTVDEMYQKVLELETHGILRRLEE